MTASFVSLVFSSIVKLHTSICSCMEGHSRLCRAVVSESKLCVQISPFSYATPCPCICQNKQLQKYNISLAWLSQNLNAASMLSLARGHFFLSFLFFPARASQLGTSLACRCRLCACKRTTPCAPFRARKASGTSTACTH